MPEWINNTHAEFVLAAYAVAVLTLAGIGITSQIKNRRCAKEWKSVTQNPENENQ